MTKHTALPLFRYEWSKLNHLQVGRYAEQLVAREITMYGLQVFSADVDDRGIDLVVRTDEPRHVDVQVKSVRNSNYIFFRKKTFSPRAGLWAAFVRFVESEPPYLYLIPARDWASPNKLLVDRDYLTGKSQPEWSEPKPVEPHCHAVRERYSASSCSSTPADEKMKYWLITAGLAGQYHGVWN